MATDALIASASSPSPPPPAQSPWDHHSAHEYSSYAGSYGSASDWGQNDNDALATFGPDDGYNPTDFDASSPDYGSLNRSGANLNFFDHENLQPDVLADLDLPPGADQQQFVSLSLTPAEPVHKHHPPSPFVNPSDLSSPGSSPGSVHNAGDGPGRHSRHSSVGSYHSPRLQPTLANYGPSPPTSPPEIKAMSPPALVIPSEPTGPSSHQSLSQSHLLPVTAGIDINIVPSTPISPGAAGQSVAFQTVLQNLNAAAAQATSSSTATRGSAIDQDPQQQHRQTTPAPLPAALAGSPRMPPASIMDSASPQVPMWNISPHGSPMPGLRHGLHLRNSSEDSVRVSHSPLQGSPNLPPAPFPRGADLATGLVNLSLGLNGGAQPFPSPQPSPNPNDMLIAANLRHHRSRSEASMNPPSWGPHAPQGSPAPAQMGPMFPPPDLGFGGLGLSGMPNSGMGGFPPGVSQTGAPSNGFAPLGFDMGHPASQPLGGVLPPFKMTPHSFDDSGDMLLPGIRRSRSDAGGHRRGVRSEDFSQYGLPSNGEGNDLLRSITTPDGALAPSDPRVSPSMRRRGSSRGSHERGSSISSGRPSPYPSPNASPRHPEEMLPMGLDGGLESSVSRPHVTTPATAVASNSRRKTEANFVCPVPGCGSTFTRHFNLKGHLRSHNEERPFKCKWPGCEKGFARQHDCKRHEALHLNIRPYTCDGCGKTFARMDALNRHLRSEGGVECRRLGDDGMDVNMSGLDQMNPAATGLHPLPLSAGNEWSHTGGLVL